MKTKEAIEVGCLNYLPKILKLIPKVTKNNINKVLIKTYHEIIISDPPLNQMNQVQINKFQRELIKSLKSLNWI